MAKAATKDSKKPRYTKYEKARMIGSRALQLSMGAPFLLDLQTEQLEELHYNPIEIAKMEFDEGVIPITVKRPLPEGGKVVEELEDIEEEMSQL